MEDLTSSWAMLENEGHTIVKGNKNLEEKVKHLFCIHEDKIIDDFDVCYFASDGNFNSGKLILSTNHISFIRNLSKIKETGIQLESLVYVQSSSKSWSEHWATLRKSVLTICHAKDKLCLEKAISLRDIHSLEKGEDIVGGKPIHVISIVCDDGVHTLGLSEKDRDQWYNQITLLLSKKNQIDSNFQFTLPLSKVIKMRHLIQTHLLPSGVLLKMASTKHFFSCDLAHYETLEKHFSEFVQAQRGGVGEGVKKELPILPQPANSLQNIALHKGFPHIPQDDLVLEVFSCSLFRGLSSALHGTLYITKTRICYQSVIHSPIEILYSNIKEIRKKFLLYVVSSLIIVTTDNEEICFTNLLFLDQCVGIIEYSLAKFRENTKKRKESIGKTTNMKDSLSLSRSTVSFDKKLRFTILLVGSRGDVQPFIALSLELIKQGHTVTIATHEAHEKFVRSFETIRYAKLAGDPKELMKLCVENDMFSSSFIKEGLAHFKTFLRDLLTSGYQACKEGTDVIIQNPPAMAGVHIAEKLKIPLFVGFTMPWSRTKYFPHGFANSFGNSWTNYYTYVAIDFAMWMPIKDLFDDFRMKELNLPAASSTEGCSLVHTRKVPHLYCWSPSVLPKPRDWEDHIHITGYWFVDTTGHYKPPAALKEFLEKEPKALYIGFGSITIPDPDGLTHIILEALTETGQRAVISAGWGGLGIGNINNPNVYLLNEVPHDWLFPQVAAVIHHGGAGTTAAGLRAGVPTAIVPFFGDQYFWGSRIEQLGVGVPYTCIKYLTSKKLASIIKTLVTNQEMKDRAKSLGEHIRDQMGCTRAIEAIYLELNRWNDKNLNTTPNDTPNQEKEKEKEQVKEKDDDFFIVNTEQFNATISQVTRKTDEAGNEYAVYTIQVTTTYSQYKPPNWDSSTPCSFHIDKRYNQFCTLHKKLQQYATLAPLPVKDYWNRFSNNVIQSRKNAFNSLLEQISKDTKLILLPEVIDFLTKD